MNIIKKLIKYNFTPDANIPIYIVIHDTGNYSVGASAEMHYRYFNSGNKNASAHLFVDDKQILQLIEFKDKSWAVGDGGNKYGICNENSINIEMCINSDCNYAIMLTNTIELTAYLMKTYNINIDKVVRHWDASRKNCPQTMNNNGNWSKWTSFKQSVQNKYNQMYPNVPQWAIDAMAFLTKNNYIHSSHNPFEKLCFGVYGAMMNNVLDKLTNINIIDYLKSKGIIKSPHTEQELISWATLGWLLANRCKETTTSPVDFLLKKGYIKTRKDPKAIVSLCEFGAVAMNAQRLKLII